MLNITGNMTEGDDKSYRVNIKYIINNCDIEIIYNYPIYLCRYHFLLHKNVIEIQREFNYNFNIKKPLWEGYKSIYNKELKNLNEVNLKDKTPEIISNIIYKELKSHYNLICKNAKKISLKQIINIPSSHLKNFIYT